MQSKLMLTSLVAVAGAAVVSANNLLTLRQAAANPLGSLSKECQADLDEVQSASDLPAVPAGFIGEAFAAAQTLSDPCAYTPTGTVAAEYTSFVSAAESWASMHTSIASRIEQNCNAAFQNIADLCPSGANNNNNTKTTSAGGAEPTASGGPANSTGGPGMISAAAGNGPAAVGALMIAALGAFALL
ncbi:hypothetical protein MY11210_003975 [Beauveria gryllotalpidicola]